MFILFLENDLISSNQSGFKTGDYVSTDSMTHEIHKSFDCSYEVRGVFLDKTF